MTTQHTHDYRLGREAFHRGGKRPTYATVSVFFLMGWNDAERYQNVD